MEQMKNEDWLEDFIKAHWSKEDLIEYFIDALGDNEILGKFMSIDQIREKLNSVIFNVMWTFNDFFAKHAAWQPSSQILFFNTNSDYISKENIKTIIVHEVLHALSTSYSKNNSNNFVSEKCGIANKTLLEEHYNAGVNEGITQGLAENITGYKDYNNGYRYETDNVYEKLCVLIGRDEILRAYLEDINNMDFLLPNEIFKNSIRNKFGAVGDNIASEVTRILALTDIITNYEHQTDLNENSIACMQKCKDEIEKIFSRIYSIIIENEQDLSMKVSKIREYSQIAPMLRESMEVEKLLKSISISESEIANIEKINILNEFIEIGISPNNHDLIIDMLLSSQVDDEKKIELLEKWHFYESSFEKLAKSNSIKSMPVSEQLNFLLGNQLKPEFFHMETGASNVIYDLCVQENLIVDKKIKRSFLSYYYKYNVPPTNLENLNDELESFRYKKIGNYYLVVGDDNHDYWYDENGEKLKFGHTEDLPNVNIDELEKLIENFKNNFMSRYNIEQARRVKTYEDVVGNICVFECMCRGSEISEFEYYEVDENGKMIRIEPRS